MLVCRNRWYDESRELSFLLRNESFFTVYASNTNDLLGGGRAMVVADVIEDISDIRVNYIKKGNINNAEHKKTTNSCGKT